MAFDPSDYRKRVLTGVEARGGVPASDPFEWYDIPLESADSVTDDAVVVQVEAVWAFWQKNRDHPKYRGLVTALLAKHPDVAPAMCERLTRLQLAAKTRSARKERDEERFAELDAAIERLVERFGGIPKSKRAGVLAFAAQAGVDQASAEARMARHLVIDDEPAAGKPAPMSEAVFRQVKANLEELGRILGRPAFVSLYDLLGLDPSAPKPVVAGAREVYAGRNRELRPDRRRALVDDLLAAVTNLLLDGNPEAYLDMLASDVTERLRPRVSAAVLVEDELTVEDYTHMVGEGKALGLDHDRAVKAVSALARELGVPVPVAAPSTANRPPSPGTVQPPVGAQIRPPSTYTPSPSGSPVRPPAPPSVTPSRPDRFARPNRTPAPATAQPASPRAWHDKLSEARAALRAGRVREAQAKVEEARQLAGGTMPPIRAIADEAANVLTEASQRWTAAVAALAARRYTEATTILVRIQAIAVDVSGPNGRTVADALAEANRATAAAAAALENAAKLPGHARELALLSALNAAPDHPGLIAALTEIGVRPPGEVRTRLAGGGLTISWTPSTSPGSVEYRVQRVGTGGQLVSVATTHRTELEVGAPGPGEPAPVFVVVARRAGIVSIEVRSDAHAGPQATQPVTTPPTAATTSTPAVARAATVAPVSVPPSGSLPPAVESLGVLPHGKRVRLVYPTPPTGRVEVRRLPDGFRVPAAGSFVADPASCGEVVPGMGPGLAVDRRPAAPTRYIALTIDGAVVAGAVAWYLELPPVTGLRVAGGLLQWEWPPGCTEVMVVWRTDVSPEGAGDPAASGSRKVTNTRYTIDGGLALPPERPMFVAVYACTRMGGILAVATNGAALIVG
jgi:hypothetical protein